MLALLQNKHNYYRPEKEHSQVQVDATKLRWGEICSSFNFTVFFQEPQNYQAGSTSHPAVPVCVVTHRSVCVSHAFLRFPLNS